MGKVDPDRLPDAVVCYLDSTVAYRSLRRMPGQKSAARAQAPYERRDEFMALLLAEYKKSKRR